MNTDSISLFFVAFAHVLSLPAIVIIFHAIYIKHQILKMKIKSPFLLMVSQLFHAVGTTFGISQHVENLWSPIDLSTTIIFPYFFTSIFFSMSLLSISIESKDKSNFSNVINVIILFLSIILPISFFKV